MVGSTEWTFSYTARIAEMLRLRITGQHGYARNLGSTPDALRTILSKFKHVRTVQIAIFTDRVRLFVCFHYISNQLTFGLDPLHVCGSLPWLAEIET